MTITHRTFGDLSPACLRLVAWMQSLCYGQIRNLRVVDGEPVFTPPPQLVRSVQLCGADGNPHRLRPDIRLKPHVVQLLDELEALGTGTVEVIKIQDGLPVHIQVALEELPTA